MVANQRVQKEMHVVVHVGELERVRERVDATRDKPHRQATATRSARQPDPGAVLSSSASSAVRILSSGAKVVKPWYNFNERPRTYLPTYLPNLLLRTQTTYLPTSFSVTLLSKL
jgi:hypothetical protein